MNAQENAAQFNRRLIGFFIWACLMAIAFVVTMQIDLRKTIFVPMVFLPLMVPVVLMPLGRSRKTNKQG